MRRTLCCLTRAISNAKPIEPGEILQIRDLGCCPVLNWNSGSQIIVFRILYSPMAKSAE